jgi:hypothetical protein
MSGFTTGSRGKVPGKACEKRTRNNNNNNNNNLLFLNLTVMNRVYGITYIFTFVSLSFCISLISVLVITLPVLAKDLCL